MTAMPTLPPTWAYVVAAISGVLLWIGTATLGGRQEAWDSSLYWSAAYPLAIAIAAGLGYLATERPWRWGLVIMLAQAVALAAAASSFGLLPLGLIMFGVLAVPPMLVARLAARLRARTAEAP